MILTKMDKEKLKQRIENFELLNNGLKNHSGAFVLTRNLRVTKEKIKCDVLVFYGEENHMHRYNDCEYPRERFLDLD
jgi:hypothetical protein